MIHRYPDSPILCSVDMLHKMDADLPGTWIATAKIDGRRRCAYKEPSGWRYIAKNRRDAQPLPDDLRKEFEALPWPDGIGLDMEWSSLRQSGDEQGLWIFDFLEMRGKWIGDRPYSERIAVMEVYFPVSQRIHQLHWIDNPGLCMFFEQQITNPLSEGIVVRRADSTLIGNWDRSVENGAIRKFKFDRIKEH